MDQTKETARPAGKEKEREHTNPQKRPSAAEHEDDGNEKARPCDRTETRDMQNTKAM